MTMHPARSRRVSDICAEATSLQLDTGLKMEALCERAAPDGALRGRPAVVFVHGTFHGAWCWAEHWMEHFARRGLECHAISLRGTSGSPADQKSVKIDEHVRDLAAFIRSRRFDPDAPPIIVGHSFGGATLLKYLEQGLPASGVVLLCSVPPSGNGPMTMRFLRRSLRQAFKITRGLALKTAATSADDARELFFEETFPDARLSMFLPR